MEPLAPDPEENFDRFIVECLETGCVWGLEGPEGWALCPSEQYNETEVIPFWSQREFAQALCDGEWSVYKPIPISLEEFIDDWLPGMHDDVFLVGVNWDEELDGIEIEPLDLIEEFDSEAG